MLGLVDVRLFVPPLPTGPHRRFLRYVGVSHADDIVDAADVVIVREIHQLILPCGLLRD